MSKIYVYIVDDEKANQEILEIMLQNYFPDFTIIGFAESAEIALNDPNLFNANLLFLDVMMPNKTGFELLQELENYPFETIFVSGYDEFAIKAFTFSAIDYILKPIDKDKFIAAVTRAIQRVQEKHILRNLNDVNLKEKIILEIIVNNKVKMIPISEISYFIGCSGGYTDIFMISGEKYSISKSLKTLETVINQSSEFIEVNKGLIVNILDIDSYDRGSSGFITMKTNNFDFFASRRKKRDVIQAIENTKK